MEYILIVLSFGMFGTFQGGNIIKVETPYEASIIVKKFPQTPAGIYNGEPPRTEFHLYDCKNKPCVELDIPLKE